MKKIAFLLLAAAISYGLFTISSCESSKSSASKLLKFNLEKGKGYDYEMTWDFNQEIMNQEIGMNMTAGYSVEVADDDGKVKTLSTMYRNIKMNMKVMGEEIDIDTDKPSEMSMEDIKDKKENPQALINKMFKGIIGKKFTMKVDEDGKVLEVTGFNKLFSDMVDSMGVDDEAKEKMMQGLSQQVNDEEIKDQFAQIFYIFPGKAVKPGDSWTISHETKGKMPAKYITTYKVKEIEGDMITLSTETKIESGEETFKIEGDQNGAMIVDSRTGLVVTADFKQDITFSSSGLSFTMKGKGRIKGTAR